MKNPMKRLATLLFVLLLAFVSAAAAEKEIPEARQKQLVQTAVSGMVQMQEQMRNTQWPSNREYRFYAEQFAADDAENPRAVVMFELPGEQVDVLCTMMKTDISGLLSVLNQQINSQYSRAYPAMMDAIGLSQAHEVQDMEGYNCVMLVYENNLMLMLVTSNRLYTTAFLSTSEIAENFGTDYAEELLASVGLKDVSLLFCRGEAVERLMESK